MTDDGYEPGSHKSADYRNNLEARADDARTARKVGEQ